MDDHPYVRDMDTIDDLQRAVLRLEAERHRTRALLERAGIAPTRQRGTGGERCTDSMLLELLRRHGIDLPY